jgi:hypothetical protein
MGKQGNSRTIATANSAWTACLACGEKLHAAVRQDINSLTKGRRFLEVGAGFGFFPKAALERVQIGDLFQHLAGGLRAMPGAP